MNKHDQMVKNPKSNFAEAEAIFFMKVLAPIQKTLSKADRYYNS